jgi:hypothetical protein
MVSRNPVAEGIMPILLRFKFLFSFFSPRFNMPTLFATVFFLLHVPCAYAENWMTFEAQEVCGDSNNPCLVKGMEATFADGTKVSCLEGNFDPAEQTVTLYGSQEQPALVEGKLPTGESYTVEAMSYKLKKNQDHLTIYADAPVVIHITGKGEVHTDGRMELIYAISPSKKIQTLLLEGAITLKSEQKGNKFCFIPGRLFLDFEQGIITALSMPSSLTSQSEQQIFFEDHFGGLFADSMTIHYDLKTQHPLKYLLEGHVRVKNIFAVNETLMGKLDQHAVADRIEYDVAEGKAILNAQNGHRVLFLDQANKMQVSAGELHILFDKETKTPSVKGIGDVRLTFGEKEIRKMEKTIKDFEAHKILPD